MIVDGPTRAGLAEDVRELLGDGVVEVRLAPPDADGLTIARRSRLSGQTPHELFAAYLQDVGVDDARLTALFAGLLDEQTH